MRKSFDFLFANKLIYAEDLSCCSNSLIKKIIVRIAIDDRVSLWYFIGMCVEMVKFICDTNGICGHNPNIVMYLSIIEIAN